MDEVIREFGDITWLADTVTVGGKSGIKGTFERSRIEKYR